MAKKSTTTGNYRCSFCGKSQEEVKKLIAGPSVYICDECIELCNEIMVEEWAQEKGEDFQHILKPKEIYSHLDQYIINQERCKKILSVGDNLNTDIKGANLLNYDSLIISNGIHKNEIKEKGIEATAKSYETICNYIQSDLKW